MVVTIRAIHLCIAVLLIGVVNGQNCIGNSTYANWNNDNFLSSSCGISRHNITASNAFSYDYDYRAAIEVPATVRAEAAALTLTVVLPNGTEEHITATEIDRIVTLCFSSNSSAVSLEVSANANFLEDHVIHYAFFYDEQSSNSTCPDAPPNQIYDYLSPAHDGPDDQDCTCNDRGTCSDVPNYCVCEDGWFGLQCQMYCTDAETCNGNGRCHRPDARCQCDDCYFGDHCEYVDAECLHLLPEPTPDCVCEVCESSPPMSWQTLLFLILCIGIVVIVLSAFLIYVVLKKIRRITEKKQYLPASILDEDEIEW